MRRTCMVMLFLCVLLGGANAQNVKEDFTFKDMDGKDLDAAVLKDSPMVINFLAEWCVACRREAQELQKAYLAYRDRGVLFLGIFLRSSDEGIRRFIDNYRVGFPVGKDTGIARRLGVHAVPVTLFVARDGRVAKRYLGSVNYSRIILGVEEILH